MTLKEAQNKAEAAKALLDEIYHAAFGGELKLDPSIEEVLDVAVDETSEFVSAPVVVKKCLTAPYCVQKLGLSPGKMPQP